MTEMEVRDAGHSQARALDIVARLAADLAGRFALTPLLERILRNTLGLLACDSGSICTVDEAAGRYRKEVDVGVECLSGHTFPLDEGVTGAIVRARGPVIFDEYAQVRGGHISGTARAGLHGVIGVPIRWNDDIIGSCVVFSRDRHRRFGPADTELLELFATHAAIAMTNARLVALSEERAREAAALAERQQVLRDLHDTVGRALATVLLNLDAAGESHVFGPAEGRTPRGTDVDAARNAAMSALSEMRRAVLGLQPEPLDEQALRDAIRHELDWARTTGALEVEFVVLGEPRPTGPETSREVLRIVQESLTNVIEHAAARHARVGLVYGVDEIAVLVDDDGCGFDIAALAGSPRSRRLGILGMSARAERLGGTVRVDSTPGWGTRVRAELPCHPPLMADDARSRWRLLIVHGSPVIRAGLVRMLAQVEPDIQVVAEIADPTQALDAYKLLKPDVVLGQLERSGIDGSRLTAYLRAADPGAAVLMLIERVGDDLVRDAARNGAVGFVRLDAEPAELARAVVAAARGDAIMTAGVFSRLTAPDADSDGLTERERQVRALVERGLPDKQIAADLRISVKTVEKHVGAILRKTGAANRTELAARSLLRR